LQLKGILSLGAAMLAAVALVAASGASTPKVHRWARTDVSTRAGVIKYLRSAHLSLKRVVIQRGARNYAGPRCPGKRWSCTTTTRTVVQIAKGRGKNIFRCATARCTVLQISKSALATNTASCIKTSGVTQSCTISQPSATGTNKAVVWMDTGKLTGLTQTAQYTASITQGPATATGSTNTNLACVHQAIFIDGSTNNTKSTTATVTNEAHQSISIAQNSRTGANTVQNAVQVGNSYDCDSSPLLQNQTLTSTALTRGTVVQKQNAANNGPNLTLDIAQNQGASFLGNASVTGANSATFKQVSSQTAIANAPTGATQTQSSPTGGILAAVNQYSTGLSASNADQQEMQCEDAQPGGLSQCDVNDPDAPAGYPLTQTQFGPAGLAKTANARHGRHFQQVRKAPGDSSQTGNIHDTFVVSQTSHQDNDTSSGQSNVLSGGITTDGTGTVTQNTVIQGTPKKNVHQGDDTTVTGNVNCAGSSCTKNLSAPTITSTPPNPDTFGHAESFSFSNVDDTVVFVCSLDGGTYTACTSPKSYPGLASGSHTFSVKTKDPDNGNLSTASPTFTWVITPPNPTITANPPNPSNSTSASFSFTDADSTALFKCQLDGGGFTSCSSPATYTGLAPGPHAFDVKATDQTGTYESTGVDSYAWTVAYIVFDGSAGTGARPSTLGGFAMTAFGADSQSLGTLVPGVSDPAGSITFSPSLQHDQIGNGWATWSNGYAGDVYDTCTTQPGPSCAATDPSQATMTLPIGTPAFYFYAEPNDLAMLTITATSDDGTTSGPISVTGNGGAQCFGFYGVGGATISSITVTTSDSLGFAVGEFGIAPAS
jgi:hypothetical protein